MNRLLWVMSLVVVLGFANLSVAQSGGGGFGPTGGPGPRTATNTARSLEAALDRIDARLKEVEAKLAKPQEAAPARPKPNPPALGGFGSGAGFGTPGGFGGFGSSGNGAFTFGGSRGLGMPAPNTLLASGQPAPRMGPPPSTIQRRPDFSRMGPPRGRVAGGPRGDFRSDRGYRGYTPERNWQRPAPSANKMAEFERRLDRLSAQLNELSREVRSQRR